MSHYLAETGIVKIKPAYVEQFGYLFNEKCNLVTDPVFEKLLDYYNNENYTWGIKHINKWFHENIKKEWIGKYQTSYEDGIFTFGVFYNINNIESRYFIFDFHDVMDIITEKVIEKDWYDEEYD